ncbi:MAG: hypothetical protein ABJA71_04675 [Ginsengibacter sp.]
MKFGNIMPKSRLTFSVSVILLIAVFFIGYYFYYIPTNKEDLYKNGFLILGNIKKSILERNEDFRKLYKTFFDKNGGANIEQTKNHIQKLLDSNNVEGDVFSVSDSIFLKEHNFLFNSLSTVNTKSKLQVTVIKENNFIYLDSNYNHNLTGILVPAESILKSIFQSQRSELFESYFLIDKKNGLIYKDPEVSIVSKITLDSLLPGSNAMLAGIKDIRIEDVRYKMFSYPFTFGNEDVVICGLIKTKKYNARLHEIPVTFIYPIVIVFLLLLIFLPIIKFYLIGSDESLKFIDVTLSALSFIIGSTLITLILIQVLLLWSADMRAKGNLETLSSQIDSAFRKDILNAYRQLDSLDNYISTAKESTRETWNVSDSIISYFRSHKSDTSLFYNFDRIFWVDSSGNQKIKGQLENAEPLFTNVSARKYFDLFKRDKPYMLPGKPGLLFGFEPVNSWTDGEFRIVISKKSRVKNQFVVGLATQMSSILYTVLPPGFGFCIINDSGEVQLHYDMSRNLQENIVEKMSPSRPVKEAIISRQTTYFNNLKFYGQTNATHITPISNIPFFLVTFYDKGYIVPVAMRIFTFALLFCFFSFFICLLIWMIAFGKRHYTNPMLYSPMTFLNWAVPRKDSCEYYILATRFLIFYILMLLLFMAFSGFLNISNYVVLVLVLLIPVNVLCSLFVISYSTTKQKTDKKERIDIRSRKALWAIGFQLLSTCLVYFFSIRSGFSIQWQFFAFQVLFAGVMLVYYFSTKGTFIFLSRSKKDYLSRYIALAAVLIICLGVLPASLYTWYAHNQEITQSVKKGQLYIAESLQKRRADIVKAANSRRNLSPQMNYYKTLQYQSGVYKIYSDSIAWMVSSETTSKSNIYEQFYFSIANDIGNNYYDPLLFPALKDTASDNVWHWSRNNATLSFWFTFPDMSLSDTSSGKSLYIRSHFPPRYLFVGFTLRGLLLILIVGCLIIGLYRLLKSLTNRIFLRKYVATNVSDPGKNKIERALSDFLKTNESPYEDFEKNIKSIKKEYDHYIPPDTRKEIYEQEREMINAVKKYKTFYDFIWQKRSEREKYMLLDFAQDNLMNFKNVTEIYCLLDEGILIEQDDEIKLFSASFRAYLITKKNTQEVYQLQKKFQQNSAWQSFRIPLLVILLGIALFIFFTQEETSQKLTAIIAGVSSVVSLLLKFFSDGGSAAVEKK